jgi:hypothetical protein
MSDEILNFARLSNKSGAPANKPSWRGSRAKSVQGPLPYQEALLWVFSKLLSSGLAGKCEWPDPIGEGAPDPSVAVPALEPDLLLPH